MERIPTWRDVPAEKLIALLSALFSKDGVLINAIFEPSWAAEQFNIPFELLPVSEILNAKFSDLRKPNGSREITFLSARTLPRDRTIAYAQGVCVMDLVISIAKGLGIKRAQRSRGIPDLAAAIVGHLKAV